MGGRNKKDAAMGSPDGSEPVTGATDPAPVVAALRKLSEDTLRAAGDFPGDVPALARTFQERAVPLLGKLDSLAYAPSAADAPWNAAHIATQARDSVAVTVVQCANRYAQGALAGSSPAKVSGLLDDARKIAGTDAFKAAIGHASQVNGRGAVCWFDHVNPASIDTAHLQPMYGDVTRNRRLGEIRYTWSRKEVIVPRCVACRAAHRRRQRIHRGVALTVGTVLTALALIFLSAGLIWGIRWARPAVGLALAIGFPWVIAIGPALWHTTGVPWRQRRGLRGYAPIAELRREGWRPGAGPIGRPGRQRGFSGDA